MYPPPIITTQSKSLLKALRVSYGIAASRSQANRAAILARSIRKTHPGIYIVGKSQVSLWRMACTCHEARTRKASGQPFRPCAHFLALYLAGEWSPAVNPVAYLEQSGQHEPPMIAWQCTLKGTRGIWRFAEAYADGWAEFTPTRKEQGTPTTLAPLADVRNLWPIWESENHA